VEAFCGSAALTLAKAPAPIEVINDIDGQIVNLFEQLRTNQDALCRLVALTPYARQELQKARKGKTIRNKLEQARRFLVASMMAINGTFGEASGGFSYSQSYTRGGREARVNRWYNLPERLAAVAERLKDVRVENMDARKLLRMFVNRPATLLYLDPPYFGERVNGYDRDETSEKFHLELLDLCNESHCMILVSAYDNELYRSKLTKDRGWTYKSIDATTRGAHGKSVSRTEILWINKLCRKALANDRVPIALKAREKYLDKVNPTRS
jgi:DNA adenine methylase